MTLPRLWKTILWSGCAPAVCMPAALIQREAQPLSFVNFRVRIRDLQSIPAYRFSRAMVFILAQNPRRNIELTSSGLTRYLPNCYRKYMPLYCPCAPPGFGVTEITSDP